MAGSSRRTASGPAFWWRLTDNLFRHLIWFLLPIIGLGAIGILQASKTIEFYRSSATLNASGNQWLPDQTGATTNWWETPASTMTRILNDQLGTNSFLTEVAERAGLSGAVENGELDLVVIQSSIWAATKGNALMSVSARWSEPQTAYELANATVDAFRQYLQDTVVSNAKEATTYYTQQLETYQAERDEAQAELDNYLASLPDEDTLTARQQVEYDTLSDRLGNVDDKITAVQAEIDAAELQQRQSQSQALSSLKVVDEAEVPTAPESTIVDRITTVGVFVVLGMIIAAIALVVTTVLDQTIASPADLLAIEGIALVATVPPMRLTSPDRPARGRRGSGRKARQRGGR